MVKYLSAIAWPAAQALSLKNGLAEDSHAVCNAKIGTSSYDESPNTLDNQHIENLTDPELGRGLLATAFSDLFWLICLVCWSVFMRCHLAMTAQAQPIGRVALLCHCSKGKPVCRKSWPEAAAGISNTLMCRRYSVACDRLTHDRRWFSPRGEVGPE